MIPHQRRDASDFPEPIVPVHPLTREQLPPGPYQPGGIFDHAIKHGWAAIAQTWTSYVVGPDGAPAHVTYDRPRQNEDGSPILTPTGKVSVEKVPTDELAVVRTVAIRAAITWERQPLLLTAVWEDDVFAMAWSLRNQRLLASHTMRPLRALLASGGAPADLMIPKTLEPAS